MSMEAASESSIGSGLEDNELVASRRTTDLTLDECTGSALGITNNFDAFDFRMLTKMLRQHARQFEVIDVGGQADGAVISQG